MKIRGYLEKKQKELIERQDKHWKLRLNVTFNDFTDAEKLWIQHRIGWWICQAQIDFIHDLIHGGAGQLEEGICAKK